MSRASRPTTGVSRTAVITAQARATETRRDDRLFSDPHAEAFVEAVGWIQVADAGRLNQEHFVLRTRHFDDYFRAAADAGIRQAVVLASGLDTRAFRLEWPEGFHLFEVDLPGLVAFKEAVLRVQRATPTCTRHVVPSDLRGTWAEDLTGAGFDPDRPTAWLIEGLMMYLQHPDNDNLLHEVDRLSAPDSRIGIEHVNRAYVDLPQMQAVQERLLKVGAAWRSTIEDPVTWLDEHGWDARVTPQTQLAELHGRPVPPLTDPERVGDAKMWLVDGIRTSQG